MTWQIAFQVFTTGLATVAVWFLYDLVREYKVFKTQASGDLFSLRAERRNFEVSVMAAGIKLDELRKSTEYSITVINHEMGKLKESIKEVSDQSERSSSFMKKTYEVVGVLIKRVENSEAEIKGVKVKMGEVTIFKSGK